MTRIHSPWRWPAAALLTTIAAVHIPLIGEHLEEAPYIGVLFIVLAVACVVLAAAILAVDTIAVWVAVGAVSVLALAAFLLSRTVGLPQIGDDIGNWTEPLGYPALVAEFLTALLASAVLALTRTGAHRR